MALGPVGSAGPAPDPTFTLETDADTFLRVMVSSDTWATAFDEDRGARER
jgi:hypothetical protein